MSAGVLADEVGRRLIDAFNRRDADGLVALAHPDVELCPTVLVGAKRVYHGHDGLRRWVAELVEHRAEHQVRVREIRDLDEQRFLLLSEIMLGEEVVMPSAMVATLVDGKIVEAHAYLSDEATLTQLDLLS